MPKHVLPSIPPSFVVDHVQHNETEVAIQCRPRSAIARCPACGQPSTSLHSRYERRIADLPWQGRSVSSNCVVAACDVVMPAASVGFLPLPIMSWLRRHGAPSAWETARDPLGWHCGEKPVPDGSIGSACRSAPIPCHGSCGRWDRHLNLRHAS